MQTTEPAADPRFDPFYPNRPFPVDSTSGTLGRRYIAAGIDNLLAVIGALVIAKQFPDSRLGLQLTAMVTFYLGYFLIFEGFFRTTPVKYLLGLTIRDFDGGPCSFRQTLVRTLLRVIEINPLLIGGLPAAVTIVLSRDRQRLGDKLARTVVVRR